METNRIPNQLIGLIAMLVLMCPFLGSAQTPQGISYQAVVRDAGGQVLSDQTVSLKIEIISGTANGNVVYEEIHDDTTNAFGLINLIIGDGQPQLGSMNSIAWGSDVYFVAVSVDLAGGNNYLHYGTTQLQSVPYAMHANTVANDSVKDDDSDPLNEMQSISMSGDTISISNGGSVVLPAQVPNFDNDSTNEMQSMTLVGDSLWLTNGGVVDLSIFNDSSELAVLSALVASHLAADQDTNASNEIQQLSIANDSLWLSDGGVVDLTPYLHALQFQAIAAQRLADSLHFQTQINGATSSLNQLNQKQASDSALLAGRIDDHTVADQDTSAVNEIQTVSLSMDTLHLSNGGAVSLVPYLNQAEFNAVYSKMAADSTVLQNGIQTNSANVNILGNKQQQDSLTLAQAISSHVNADGDTSASNELQVLSASSSGTTRTLSISSGNNVSINVADNDNSASNELQQLSLSNDTISLSQNGGNLSLAAYLDNTDAQTLSASSSGTSRTLSISGGNNVSINVADNDNSASNELQQLSLSNDTISLSQNGGDLSLAAYLDNTDAQTLSASSSGTSRTLSISGGNNVSINVADNDNSASNELQQISLSNDTISLSQNGGDLSLAAYLDNTDEQTLEEVLDEDNDAATKNIENVGDLQLAPNKVIYLGDPAVNNTWRIRVDGIELKFEMKEGGSWVEKVAFRQ